MSRPSRVLLISGLLGFWVGIVGFPTWAIAVESAQVVAGVVKYPATNPFYIYHTRIWTLLVQVPALLLRAGVSEIVLSRLLSGVIGMVSFQALAMFVYALCGDALIAIGAAFVVVFSRITDFGVVYPVMLLDTHHTYGALGLSFIVLVIALIGAGFYRAGAFLIGLSPAVHPSLGFWCGLITFLSLAPDVRRMQAELRPAFRYFVLGAAVTFVSLAVQLTMIAHRLPVDRGVAAAYFRQFVGVWDEHRRAVHMSQPGVILNWGALALALVALRTFIRDLPPGSRFLLRTVVVSAAVGIGASFYTWVPAIEQPVWLSTLMPARVLNYDVMVIAPLAIGLLAMSQHRLASRLVLGAFLAALLVNARSPLPWHYSDPMFVLEIGIAATAAVVLATAIARLWVPGASGRAAPEHRSPGFLASGARRLAYAACIVLMLVAVVQTLRQVRSSSYYRDRTNDPLFATMGAESKGVALTAGSYQLVQLYTRRPILLDGGGTDTMAYAPDTGPTMGRIFRDVYDVDFFNPPDWARGLSMMPHDYVRSIWQRFSPAKWQDIRRVYGVTQVLTSTNYNLQLPIVAEEGSFRLYSIPESDEGRKR